MFSIAACEEQKAGVPDRETNQDQVSRFSSSRDGGGGMTNRVESTGGERARSRSAPGGPARGVSGSREKRGPERNSEILTVPGVRCGGGLGGLHSARRQPRCDRDPPWYSRQVPHNSAPLRSHGTRGHREIRPLLQTDMHPLPRRQWNRCLMKSPEFQRLPTDACELEAQDAESGSPPLVNCRNITHFTKESLCLPERPPPECG
jgi:hypothetical protein